MLYSVQYYATFCFCFCYYDEYTSCCIVNRNKKSNTANFAAVLLVEGGHPDVTVVVVQSVVSYV